MIFSSVFGKFARFARIAAGVIVSDFLQIVAPAQKIPTVLGVQVDATLDPGASPADRDAYILTNTAALHANFGSIAGVGDGDIVMFKNGAFRIVFDASAADANDRLETFDVSTDTKYKFSGGWSRDELGSMALQSAGSGPTEYRDNAAQDTAIGAAITAQGLGSMALATAGSGPTQYRDNAAQDLSTSSLTDKGGRRTVFVSNTNQTVNLVVGTEYVVYNYTPGDTSLSKFVLPVVDASGEKIWITQRGTTYAFQNLERGDISTNIVQGNDSNSSSISLANVKHICLTSVYYGLLNYAWYVTSKETM